MLKNEGKDNELNLRNPKGEDLNVLDFEDILQKHQPFTFFVFYMTVKGIVNQGPCSESSFWQITKLSSSRLMKPSKVGQNLHDLEIGNSYIVQS